MTDLPPDQMEQALEPCPLCDDPMKVIGQLFQHTDSDADCLLARHAWATEKRQIEAWNTRAAPKSDLDAALSQNAAMCAELSNVGNLVSDLAKVMGVDQSNTDGSWPDLAGRIQKLIGTVATPAPKVEGGADTLTDEELCQRLLSGVQQIDYGDEHRSPSYSIVPANQAMRKAAERIRALQPAADRQPDLTLTDDRQEAVRLSSLKLAIKFHDTYERLAPQFGYETREETRVFDPDSPNGKLMVAVCASILASLKENSDVE